MTVVKQELLRLGVRPERRAIRKLNLWLNFLGFLPTLQEGTEGFFTHETHAALVAFQKAYGLAADGVFGARSFSEMQGAIMERCKTKILQHWGTAYCDADDLEKMRTSNLLNCPATPMAKGMTVFPMRADAAYWLLQIWHEAQGLGVAVPSAGGIRALSAKVSQGRIATSMHYPALAFDLHTGAAMNKPETDPFVVEAVTSSDGCTRWRVWARCDEELAKANALPIVHIKNPVTYIHRLGTKKPVQGYFINFTALCEKYHFRSIAPRASFLDMSQAAGKVMMGAEWWHFQNDFCLFEGWSTFFNELRKLYSTERLDAANGTVRKGYGATYGIDWN